MPLEVDAAAKGDKRKGWDGEDRRWTECNGTSNSNMPAISRSDALMRDALGDEAERWRERGRKRWHRGACCLLAKDESLMRSQPRDYPAKSRGRLHACYRWAWMPPGRHVPQECHYAGEERILWIRQRRSGQPARFCTLLRRDLSAFCDINSGMYTSELSESRLDITLFLLSQGLESYQRFLYSCYSYYIFSDIKIVNVIHLCGHRLL